MRSHLYGASLTGLIMSSKCMLDANKTGSVTSYSQSTPNNDLLVLCHQMLKATNENFMLT